VTTPGLHHGIRPLTAGVAELQGLYGPFTFPEKLLQKIWLRGDYARRACRTTDGRVLEVLYPGKWNLLGGPDFKGARLYLDGIELTGDVELHLHARDWAAHRHAADPAYANVVLHVVLFPPGSGYATRGAGEREIPLLVLLPLLHHDLEEFAADEAVETLANRPLTQAVQELSALDQTELTALIQRGAAERWREKIHFAQRRVQRLGWEAACHQTALEILGYRFNRTAMLRVAGRFALSDWITDESDGAAAFAAEEGTWTLHGVRPANHPRVRLRQYARWATGRPAWPQLLEAVAAQLPVEEISLSATAEFRRTHRLAALRAELSRVICAGAFGGPRFDTMVCDGFLPLLAARGQGALEAIWFHWYPGDQPVERLRTLRFLGVTGSRSHPVGHGAGQGLFGWLIEREKRAATSNSSPGGARGLTRFGGDRYVHQL